MLIQFFFLLFFLFAFPFSHFLVDAHYRPKKTSGELMQCRGDYVIYTHTNCHLLFLLLLFFCYFRFHSLPTRPTRNCWAAHTKDPHRQANNRNCINIYANAKPKHFHNFVCLSCGSVGLFLFSATIFAFVFIALI